LIDDAGIGNPSTFAGPIETPKCTRMTESGLRYNRFHVTALCSPFSGYAGLDIGRDNGRVVDLSYENRKPFPSQARSGSCSTSSRSCREATPEDLEGVHPQGDSAVVATLTTDNDAVLYVATAAEHRAALLGQFSPQTEPTGHHE
jgi:hypothetical protein